MSLKLSNPHVRWPPHKQGWSIEKLHLCVSVILMSRPGIARDCSNYSVTIIPSGCCGMAGSFGYEKEHYEISMTIGEQTLFPSVRKASKETIISANGTSCRHQIKDGTGRVARHPISILKEALL